MTLELKSCCIQSSGDILNDVYYTKLFLLLFK